MLPLQTEEFIKLVNINYKNTKKEYEKIWKKTENFNYFTNVIYTD